MAWVGGEGKGIKFSQSQVHGSSGDGKTRDDHGSMVPKEARPILSFKGRPLLTIMTYEDHVYLRVFGFCEGFFLLDAFSHAML